MNRRTWVRLVYASGDVEPKRGTRNRARSSSAAIRDRTRVRPVAVVPFPATADSCGQTLAILSNWPAGAVCGRSTLRDWQ